jgi:hypothetical protein
LPDGALEGWQAIVRESSDHLSSQRLQLLAQPQPPPVILPAGHDAADPQRPFSDRVAGVWGRVSGSQLLSTRAKFHTSRLTTLRFIVNLTALPVLDVDFWKPKTAKQDRLGM